MPHSIDEPPAVIDDCFGRSCFAREQTERAFEKEGEAVSVKEEPTGERHALGPEDTDHLAEVILSLPSEEVGEYGMGDEERAFPVLDRERLTQLQTVSRRIPGGIHVMMKELEVRIEGRQVLFTPINHPPVNINPYISARSGILLQQLPRYPPTATAEIEHRLISIKRESEPCVDRFTTRIIEGFRVCRADHPP
jgi:hypothetical protein